MKNWHKIDLHHHTLNEITFDGRTPKSFYSHEKFENVLKEEEVELKAVTNHNTLNIIDHIKHALICKKNNVNYLPGVEIDYLFNSKNLHAITILNPLNDIIRFSLELSKIIDSKTGNKFLNEDEFAKLHENTEFIFIPHVMKTKGIYSSKNKKLKAAEDWVINMIRNGIFVPVIFENTQNYNKYSIYGRIKELLDEHISIPCYVGSDFKFDNDEKRRQTAVNRIKYYIFSEPTYRGLEIAVRNHETRLAHESELIVRNNYIESINIKGNNNFNSVLLELSPALNVIIGGSGSGKTLLLNEIYRSIQGKDLNVVKNNDDNKNKRAYHSKVGNDTILEIVSVPYDYKRFKVIEIPNIYAEIIKYINNTEKLGEVFGISNRTPINTVINEFISQCDKYDELNSEFEKEKKIGSECLEKIIANIDFLNINRIESSMFELNPVDMTNLQSLKTESIIRDYEKLIAKKDEVYKYFEDIDKALNLEHTDTVDEIKNKLMFLLKKLNDKIILLKKRQINERIKEKIQDLLNKAIRKSSENLGQKERRIKERNELLLMNQQELINHIKKILTLDRKLDCVYLEYPFDKIKSIIETQNANEFARFTLSFDKDNLRNVSTLDGYFIETKNISMKLRNLSIKYVDFLSDTHLKTFIDELRNSNLNIKSVLKTELPLTLELYINETWKKATSVNQGTIAKFSMEYFFKNIIKSQQPDIIFIDQPENDVDKEFLTQTLAKFLMDAKLTSQIFITSHDAILTVNADANVIIQADVDADNKINYMTYPMEFVDSNKLGTDNVARILDGGKNNIAKRYQIYGGILKYEN